MLLYCVVCIDFSLLLHLMVLILHVHRVDYGIPLARLDIILLLHHPVPASIVLVLGHLHPKQHAHTSQSVVVGLEELDPVALFNDQGFRLLVIDVGLYELIFEDTDLKQKVGHAGPSATVPINIFFDAQSVCYVLSQLGQVLVL